MLTKEVANKSTNIKMVIFLMFLFIVITIVFLKFSVKKC
jgi:hypothetical protein